MCFFVLVGAVKDIPVTVGNENEYGILSGQIVDVRCYIAALTFFAYLLGCLHSVFDYHTVVEALQENCLQQPQYGEYDNSEEHEAAEQFFSERMGFTLQIYTPPLEPF